MREVTLAKGNIDNKAAEDVTIYIRNDLPSILDMRTLYDTKSFFRIEAMKLAEVLDSSLPKATLEELVYILGNTLYNEEQGGT